MTAHPAGVSNDLHLLATMSDPHSEPSASIVIPCYNEAQYIADQLQSLVEQQGVDRFEVLVADNGSTDDSAEIARSFADRLDISVIDASARRGPAFARNEGTRNARAEFVFFIDADDALPADWLATMSRALADHDLITCRFNTEILNEPWQAASWTNGQAEGPLTFDPPFLPFAGAGALGVRRSMHERVGGFDESMRVLEDADYCWRIQLADGSFHFVSETEIHYRFPKKAGVMFRQMRMLGQYHAFLYKKYAPHGMPRHQRPWKEGLCIWRGLAKRALRARRMDQTKRAELIRLSGYYWGRLVGSARYGVVDP